MAGLGLTKLQVINRMLLALGAGRVAALDSGGASDAAEAEYFLDQLIDQAIIEGHPSCVERHVSITCSGGEIDLSSAHGLTRRIMGSGKYQGRKFSIRGTKVYDEIAGSTVIGAASEVVTLDLFKAASASSPANFEDLAPDLKYAIAERAVQEYRFTKRPDQLVDATLARRVNKAEIAAAMSDETPFEQRPKPPRRLQGGLRGGADNQQ